MSWMILVGVVLALGVALFAALMRRSELARMRQQLGERERAVQSGSAKAQLQHPVIDLSRCLGCGACVRACPEDGVLALVHGQALVVNGARCRGHANCETECPVAAITVTLTDVAERRDIPALTPELEAIGAPGLFLAGEVTAHALIKSAIEQGTAVAATIARRERTAPDADVLDVCIVGAGPAGLACSLEAKRHGLRFVTLDQETLPGGTVARYPRRKLVMMRPVDLPLHGRLANTSYTKEELVELWSRIANEEHLPIRCGEAFESLERTADGGFVVHSTSGVVRARNVVLAIGRRGTPRRLEVPGEDLPKVAYSLLDAQSYQGRRILVVGGGDSAVEAALALAEQPGNKVTISYRQESFFRATKRSESRLRTAVEAGRVRVLTKSHVLAIHADSVDIAIDAASLDQTSAPFARTGPAAHERGNVATALDTSTAMSPTTLALPNDEVFVMAGGIAPFEMLERAGVSLDPALRPKLEPPAELGTGLTRAIAIAFVLSLATLGWALTHADYYLLPAEARPEHLEHDSLRPSLGIGLALGITSAVLVVVNLLYLARRAQWRGFTWGHLSTWMTSHVATGILALLLAVLHGGMAPRNTVGGHALLALAVLLVTGAIGRYFYAYVPRAANGRELEIDEVRAHLERIAEGWDHRRRGFVERVCNDMRAVIDARQWRTTFLGRVGALLGGQRDMKQWIVRLREDARVEGLSHTETHELITLAKRAHRAALTAAHFEDLRSILATWRYLHRWVAALMVLLLVLHIVSALNYGSHWFGGVRP